MRIAGRRYRDEWIPNYYPARNFGSHSVRISRSGNVIVLSEDEEAQLNEFFMEDTLFNRLASTGHIITRDNPEDVFDKLSTWMKGTYDGPGLHIIVATRRCNLNCSYCHMYPQPMDAPRDTMDLDPALIPQIAKFIVSSPRSKLSVEFQGGEPFLNFPAIRAAVAEINQLASEAQKTVNFGIVTNLMVVSDEQLRYCQDNKIKLSFSLNGPQEQHDLFRITRSGAGSHGIVMRRIEDIHQRFPGLLASYPLCVVTAQNSDDLAGLADYYFSLGFREVGLIHLKNLGNARGNVHFEMKDFVPHYLRFLETLYEHNKDLSNTPRTERTVKIALTKIVSQSDPLFVDWRNPIGYFSNSVVYNTDGTILPVDEARSFGDLFSVGNVLTDTYDQLIRERKTFQTLNLSIRDRDSVCRECTYNPYCGVSPVLHYAKTSRMQPEPHVSAECLLVIAVFDWIFKKLVDEDPIPLLRMVPGYVSTVLAQSRAI